MNSEAREPSAQLSHTFRGSMRRLSIVASVVVLLSACGNEKRSLTPTSPRPRSPAAPITTYTLSGTVSEASPSGLRPVEGVQVQEEKSGQHVVTDGSGFYTLSGLSATSSSITATKTGYDPTRKAVVLTGDARLDLELSRIGPHILSGMVFEMTNMGRMPVENVSVYCDSCGDPLGHTWSDTDAEGFYSFSWTANGSMPLIVRKEGYRLAGNLPPGPIDGWIVATVRGNTRFDIELVRR